ncbi:carbamoyltransferase [Candidatus Azambacteria bacterium]|nr:carbamoyltransferase [Candidatus Azambacteria bacterium]
MKTYILGISCYYHDSAACLLGDGEVIAAAEEERFSRKKHDADFPTRAIAYCLREAGLEPKDLAAVAFYDKPLLKFERILLSYLGEFPRSYFAFFHALSTWLSKKLWVRAHIRRALRGFTGPIYFSEHHMAHAASAFYPSGFEKAAILTVDGVGEWETTTAGIGEGTHVTLKKAIHYPHSLGLLYAAVTYFLGFKVNSGEYKVMGLAPYGEPRFLAQMQRLIEMKPDGSFALNLKYFTYPYGMTMTGRKFEKLFGIPRRLPEGPLEQVHKDIAASLQRMTEEIILTMARSLHEETMLEAMCLAGGVALNAVANGKILRETPFKKIFIQPAAGDSGGAVGAAYLVWHEILNQPRGNPWEHVYFGPGFSNEEIERTLQTYGLPSERLEEEALIERMVTLLKDHAVIGWFQGRMEFGPRALGNRSILADPRNPENKDRVNLKIKKRESFRPFAPSVTLDDTERFFDLSAPSPYMILVAPVRDEKRSTLPAVTHVDGSARLHTVAKGANPLYHRLIERFGEETGVPVLINTSFNVRGEPIVCTPEEAINGFLATGMDALAIGPFLIEKKNLPESLRKLEIQQLFEAD